MRYGWLSGRGPGIGPGIGQGLTVLVVGLLGLLAPWALVAVALVVAVWAIRHAPGSTAAMPSREREQEQERFGR